MFNRRTMLMSLMLAPVAARADGGRTVSGDAFRSGLKQWRMEAIGDARWVGAGAAAQRRVRGL